MVRKVRRPGTPVPEQPKPPAFREQLGLYRDALDAILKTGAVSLPIPAILIYNYLKLIGHQDLFAASVLSLAGLSALLQAFFLVWVALTVCIVIPSFFICFLLSGTSDQRPTRGLPTYVLVCSVIWAAYYFIASYVADQLEAVTWRYWTGVGILLLVVWAVFGAVAWWSPGRMNVVPELAPDAATWSRNRRDRKAEIAKPFRALRVRRGWRCFGISAAIVCAGIYAVSSIYAVLAFAGSMNLPQHGWKISAIVALVVVLGFFPGAVYLKIRASNGSHGKALKYSLVLMLVITYFALLNGFSAEPIALVAMKGMAVIDNAERTYEILKLDERPVYQALGYKPKAGDRFVQAFVRFQFADVKLVCPRKYPFPEQRSSSDIKDRGESNSDAASVVAPHTSTTHDYTDPVGCLTPTKDEIRVVNLPEGFHLPADPPAGASPTTTSLHNYRVPRTLRPRHVLQPVTHSSSGRGTRG